MNKLRDLVPGMQRRRIDAGAVEAAVADGVEDGEGGADAVDGGAAHVVLGADALLRVKGVVEHGVLEDGDERRPERGGGGEAGVFDGCRHQEVEVRHVREMLVAFLVIGEVHVACLA